MNADPLDAGRAEALNARLAERWEAMRARLSHVMRPAAALHAVLARPRRPRICTGRVRSMARPYATRAGRHGETGG